MSFHRYLSRIGKSWNDNRSTRRAKKRLQQRRPSFFRPNLEHLEDRIVLSAPGDELMALHNAASTVNTIASDLESGALKQSVPIITGSSSNTNTLSQILGVSSTFSIISSALNQIDPNTIKNSGDLKTALGSGFSVTDFNNNDDGRILITYTQSAATPSELEIAQNAGDFFGQGQQNPYFSIKNLTGTVTDSFTNGSGYSINFGADSNGFFIDKSPSLFSGSFNAQTTLNGQVNIRNLAFDVNVTGTGELNLNSINLSLNEKVYDSKISNLFSDVNLTYDNTSGANATGDFEAQVFGTTLVKWTPTISWTFGTGGALQQANVSIKGAPSALDPKALQAVLAQSVENALGFSKYNVPINPLAGLPPDFQDIIVNLTSILQGGLDDPKNSDPNNDPQQELNQVANKPVNPSYVVSTSDLVNILMGNPGDLIKFEPQTDLPSYQHGEQIPVFFLSLAGILNFTFTGGVDFNINGNAGLGFGIDTSGVFVETDPTITHLQYSMSVGANIGVTGDVLDLVNIIKGKLGPTLTTTATLTLDNSSPDGKLHLSNVNSLSDLGNWLQDHLNLHVDVDGSIDLDVTAFSPQGGFQDKIKEFSPEAAQELGPIIKGAGDVADFFSGAAEDLCQQAKNTPFEGIAAAVSGGNCDNVKKATEIAFGQFAPYLVQYALQDLGAEKYDASGNLRTYVDDSRNAHLFWSWPLVHYSKDFGPSQIVSGTSSANSGNNTNVQSDPNDFIQYSVNGPTLNITGQAGTDNIRIVDLGNDNIELFRSGVDSLGVSHTDTPVIFTGITQINSTMNDSAGSQSSFIMDSSLSINTSVTGGAGDDTIITGGGNDTIHGGSGKDYLKSTGGTNHTYAGSGDSILIGGSGTDSLYGGSGNDILQAGSGTEYLDGGAGDDTLAAFNNPSVASGLDVLYGGSGNNHLIGGSGTSILYGKGSKGEGSSSDQNTFDGGSGTVTMHGGLGDNTYFAGTGTSIVYGGALSDEINWQVGDGNMTIDGGVDPSDSKSVDVLQLEGSNGANGPDSFTVSKSGNGIGIAAPGAILTASNIQLLNIDDGLGGTNNTVVNDLSGTSVVLVEINFSEVANPDGVHDSTTLNVADGNKTVNIGTVTGTNEFNSQQGPIMYVTGAVGPVVLLANQDDSLSVNGGMGVNQFNVLAVSGTTTINTKGGQNTVNVGSNAPDINGNLSGIQGALILNGSNGADTANVDDSAASTGQRSGMLTPTTLTGLGMGPSGITFSGLTAFNLNVGPGALTTDTFDFTEVNVSSLVTGPTYALFNQIPVGKLSVAYDIGSVHVNTGTPGSLAGPTATVTLFEGYSPWLLHEVIDPPANNNGGGGSPPPNPSAPSSGNSSDPQPPASPPSSPPAGNSNGDPQPTDPPGGNSSPGTGSQSNTNSGPVNAPTEPTSGESPVTGAGPVTTAALPPFGGSSPIANSVSTAAPAPALSPFMALFELELKWLQWELAELESLWSLLLSNHEGSLSH